MNRTVIDYLKLNREKYGEKPAIVCEGNHISFTELYYRVLATGKKISVSYVDNDSIFAIENKRSIETIVLMLSVVAGGKVYTVVNSATEALGNYIFLDESYIEAVCLEGYFLDEGELGLAYTLPMYEICTSGTTGEPKRIVKGQGDLLEFIEDFADKFSLDSDDVFLNQLEFTFDASTKDIYCMVVLGATLHIASRKQLNFPAEFVKYVSENDITVFITTPFYMKNMARMNGLNENVPMKLKYVMFVGESMKSEYLNYWIENMKYTTFVNLYGSSELAGNSLYYVVNDKVKSELVPLKECFLDYEYYVDDGHLVLERKSRHLIFETGDMAEICEDAVFINGRCDNIRKVRGYRISLENIEKEVARVSPVKEALCEQHQDSVYVVFTSDEEGLDTKWLQKELKDFLPRYVQPLRLKQVKELPINANGKFDRKRIIEQFK